MENRSYLFLLLLCPLIALFTLASSPMKHTKVDKIDGDYYSRHIRDVVVKRERNFATHGISNLNEENTKSENNSTLLQLPKQTDKNTKLGKTFKTNIERRKKRTLCSCEDIDEDYCLPECSNPCPCTTAAPTPKIHLIQTPERPPPAQNPPVIIPPQNPPPQQNIGLSPPVIQPLTNTVPSNVGTIGLHPGVASRGLATGNANIQPQSHQAVLLPIPSNPVHTLTNPNLNSLNPLLSQANQAPNFGYSQTSNSGAFSRNQFTNSNPTGLNMVNPGLSGVSQQSYLIPVSYVPLTTANGIPTTYTNVAPLVNPGNQGNFGNQGSSFNNLGQSYGNQGANYGGQPSNSNNQRPNYGNQGSNYGNQGSNYGNQAPNSNSQQTNYGSQGSNYNNPRPNYGSQGSNYGNQGSNYGNQGSSNGNQGSNLNQRPNHGNQGASYGNQAANVNNQGSNVGNQGSSYGNQGSNVNNQGTVNQGSNQGPSSANQESNAGSQGSNLPTPNYQVPASAIEVPNSLSVNSQSSPNPSNLPGNSGNAGNTNPPGSTSPSVATNPQPQTPVANQAHNPFAPGSALSSSKASPTRPPESNERSAQNGAHDVQKNPSVESLHDHEERTTNGKGQKSKSLHDMSVTNLDGKYETKNSGNKPLKNLMRKLLKKLSKYEASFSGGMEKSSLIVKTANGKAASPMQKVSQNLAKQRMKAKRHKGKSSRHKLKEESSKDSTHARKTKYHHRKEAWKKAWKEIEGSSH